MMNEPLTQELKAITDYLDMIDPQWRTKIAATGAHGSMTVSEKPLENGRNWVTSNAAIGVNARARPNYKATKLSTFPYQTSLQVLSRRLDEESHINPSTGIPFLWYETRLGWVREDVVTFSELHPHPVVPHSSTGKWPSPIAGRYAIENTHLNHRNHKGVDLSAPMGTNIINHVDAFVLRAFDCVLCKPEGDGAWTINNNDYGDGYGTFAILRYDSWSLPSAAQQHVEHFVFVLYGHMSDIDVTQGFPVRADSRIGRVGSTGNSSGPHLHLEVRTSDTPNVNFYSAKLIDPALIFDL